MENSQREDSPDTDQFHAILAETDRIRAEHTKENQEAEAKFKNECDVIQNDIQQLQKKMRDMEDDYKASARRKKRLQKKQLEKIFRMPLPVERHDTEAQDVATGSTETNVHEPEINRTGRHFEDAITVHDSESEGAFTDDRSMQQAAVRADMISRERTNTPELTEPDVIKLPERRKRQRLQVRIAEPDQSGEQSDARPPRPKKPRRKQRVDSIVVSSSASASPRSERNKHFGGVVDPVIGRIYKVLGLKKNGIAAVALPTNNFDAIGISRSMSDTSLGGSVRACYRYSPEDGRILGWEKDYDNGGPKVTSREFPFMFFDGLEYIPLEGEFTATNARFAWVHAKSIRTFSVEAPISHMVAGYSQAKRFSHRLRLMSERQEEQDQQIGSNNESGSTSTVGRNETVGQIPRTFLSKKAAGKLPERNPAHDAIYEVPEDSVANDSDYQNGPQSSWQVGQNRDDAPEESHMVTEFPTLESIYQETSEADSGDDGSDGGPYWSPSNVEEEQQIIELLLEAQREQAKITNDNHPGNAGTPAKITRSPQDVRTERSHDRLPDRQPHSPSGFVQRRFNPTPVDNITTIDTIDTNFNNGNFNNHENSAASTSSTQTLTHSPGQSSRTGNRGNDVFNAGSTTTFDSSTRNTASGALSYYKAHFGPR